MSGESTATGVRLARRLLNRKFRSEAGEFLVEGAQCVREAVGSGQVRRVLATPEAAKRYPDLVGDHWEPIEARQVRHLSDTVTPQGLFAICDHPGWSSQDVFTPQARLVVICSQVRDPGNLGTVIRCADAFGADGVVVTENSVDPTNPKTLRASVGSFFHLPVVADADLADTVAQAKALGFTVLAADGSGEDLNQVAGQGGLRGKVAWIMGNEAWGMDAADLALADAVVRVPMRGGAESLNLSTAAAVCLYVTAWQGTSETHPTPQRQSSLP